jgi:Mitochondrial carrier protein
VAQAWQLGNQWSGSVSVTFTKAARAVPADGVASACLQTLTYPLDLVRRRMQVQALAAAGAPALGNTWAALRDIARSAGWRGLFSGLSINYMKVGFCCRCVGFWV